MNKIMKWLRPDRHPAIRQNRDYFADFDQDRSIESYEFVSVDTELTGLTPRRDAIVSIGAVRIRNLRIVTGENFLAYVRPKRSLPRDSTLIHRITPEQLQGAPQLREVLPEFIDWCGDALLVGHFVSLDLAFLNRASKRLLGGPICNPAMDTMRLARAYEEQQWRNYYDRFNLGMSFNLGALAKRYGLPLFEQHDALEDAFQTACLFLFLVKRIRGAGCETLKEVNQAGRVNRAF